ncbi:hypothetical protein [Aquimarina rhabdastrellae]
MKHLKLKALALGLVMLGVWSCETEEATQEVEVQETIELEDNIEGLKEDEEEMPLITKIKTYTGSEVYFYGSKDYSGKLVLEDGECSSCMVLSRLSSLSEEKMNAFDIFWALSEPGVEVPEIILQEKKEKSLFQKQGWARSELEKTNIGNEKLAEIACNNNSFKSSINGGFVGGKPDFIDLDIIPKWRNLPKDCYSIPLNGVCAPGQRYRYTAQYNGIKSWGAKLCIKSVETPQNTHKFWLNGRLIYKAPTVYFSYYNRGKWHVPSGSWREVAANHTRVIDWRWITSINSNFRFKLRYLRDFDQVDIMMDK